MDSSIKEKNDHVIVNINKIEDKKELILQNLNDCKEGKCSCPTNEYDKLNKLDIQVNNEVSEIIIDLEPKEGQKIAVSEIQKCLDYTTKKVNNTTN